MAKADKTVRHPSGRVLAAINDGLQEIAAHFELSGFSPVKGGPTGEVVAEEPEEQDSSDGTDSDDYEDYEGSSKPDYFDREDIEIAIDEFISQLIKANVMRKSGAGKAPSFSDVFEKFFGEDHEITTKAKSFEDYIKGYFGAISPEDMRAAYDEFLDIQETVREALERTHA
jgi:hypothetical protein